MGILGRLFRATVVILTNKIKILIRGQCMLHNKYFSKNQNIFAKSLYNSKDVVKDFSENRNRIDFDLVQTVL